MTERVEICYNVKEGKEMLNVDSGELEERRFLLDLNDWLDKDVAAQDSPNYCYGAFHDNSMISYARLNTLTLNKVNDLLIRTFKSIASLCGRLRCLQDLRQADG